MCKTCEFACEFCYGFYPLSYSRLPQAIPLLGLTIAAHLLLVVIHNFTLWLCVYNPLILKHLYKYPLKISQYTRL